MANFTEKLERRLRLIYGENYQTEIVKNIISVIASYSKIEARKSRWDENDIVLITYGDSIRKTKEIPLTTLKHFLDKELKDQLSVVHILPFFPYSSDEESPAVSLRNGACSFGKPTVGVRLTQIPRGLLRPVVR